MWDDATESLWQQVTGEAVVGALVGTFLEALPSSNVAWSQFKSAFPGGTVLDGTTLPIHIGSNPYAGYSSRPGPPHPVEGEDGRLPAVERVVGVAVGNVAKAFPFPVLAAERPVNDTVGELPIVVMWGAPDTAGALDGSEIREGRPIGVGVAYSREVGGRILTFVADSESTSADLDTGSVWNMLGRAIKGDLTGVELSPVLHTNE